MDDQVCALRGFVAEAMGVSVMAASHVYRLEIMLASVA